MLRIVNGHTTSLVSKYPNMYIASEMYDYLFRYREPNISIKPDDAVRCIEDSTLSPQQQYHAGRLAAESFPLASHNVLNLAVTELNGVAILQDT